MHAQGDGCYDHEIDQSFLEPGMEGKEAARSGKPSGSTKDDMRGRGESSKFMRHSILSVRACLCLLEQLRVR